MQALCHDVSPGVLRWETEKRYYLASLNRDLFGDWVVTRVWGGRSNRLGRISDVPVPDFLAGIDLLNQIAQQRKRRGYQQVQ